MGTSGGSVEGVENVGIGWLPICGGCTCGVAGLMTIGTPFDLIGVSVANSGVD